MAKQKVNILLNNVITADKNKPLTFCAGGIIDGSYGTYCYALIKKEI